MADVQKMLRITMQFKEVEKGLQKLLTEMGIDEHPHIEAELSDFVSRLSLKTGKEKAKEKAKEKKRETVSTTTSSASASSSASTSAIVSGPATTTFDPAVKPRTTDSVDSLKRYCKNVGITGYSKNKEPLIDHMRKNNVVFAD